MKNNLMTLRQQETCLIYPVKTLLYVWTRNDTKHLHRCDVAVVLFL